MQPLNDKFFITVDYAQNQTLIITVWHFYSPLLFIKCTVFLTVHRFTRKAGKYNIFIAYKCKMSFNNKSSIISSLLRFYCKIIIRMHYLILFSRQYTNKSHWGRIEKRRLCVFPCFDKCIFYLFSFLVNWLLLLSSSIIANFGFCRLQVQLLEHIILPFSAREDIFHMRIFIFLLLQFMSLKISKKFFER